MEKIKSFEQLLAWQKAQDLSAIVYQLTKSFPSDEKFGLVNQMRRAANSVSANIAEGFGRRANGDKLQFYAIAYGSLLELKSFLYLSTRLGFIRPEDNEKALDILTENQKLLNALMKSIRDND